MFKALFNQIKVDFHTDNVRASVTNSMGLVWMWYQNELICFKTDVVRGISKTFIDNETFFNTGWWTDYMKKI